MQDYKKMKIWQKAHLLVLHMYKLSSAFPKEENYGLTSQLKRAITSVPANIAEGAGRNTNLDFAKFLNIALGSLNESSYYLLLARDLNYLHNDEFQKLDKEISELKAMLIGFISAVRNSVNS